MEGDSTPGQWPWCPPSTSYPPMEWGEGGCNITLLVTRCSLLMSAVLGKVYENVVFFGDFVLRMPDMTKKVNMYYYKHKWCIFSCACDLHVIYMWPTCTLLYLLFRFTGNIRNGFRFSSGLLDFVTSQVASLLAHMQHSFTWWVTTYVASE